MKVGDIVKHVNGTDGRGIILSIDGSNARLANRQGVSMVYPINKLRVCKSLRCTVGGAVKLARQVNPYRKGAMFTLLEVIRHNLFIIGDPSNRFITPIQVTAEDLLTLEDYPIYEEEEQIKTEEKTEMTPIVTPETELQINACAEAVADAIAAKLAEDKKIFTAQMAEYIKIEGERIKLDERCKALEKALSITDEIKATLF